MKTPNDIYFQIDENTPVGVRITIEPDPEVDGEEEVRTARQWLFATFVVAPGGIYTRWVRQFMRILNPAQ